MIRLTRLAGVLAAAALLAFGAPARAADGDDAGPAMGSIIEMMISPSAPMPAQLIEPPVL